MQFIRVYNSDGGYSDLALRDATAPFEFPVERSRHMFSYTQLWEKAVLDNFSGNDNGLANFTAEFERTLGTGPRYGPGAWTTPSDHPYTQRV